MGGAGDVLRKSAKGPEFLMGGYLVRDVEVGRRQDEEDQGGNEKNEDPGRHDLQEYILVAQTAEPEPVHIKPAAPVQTPPKEWVARAST